MKTLALVIGNNNYHETAKLKNAVNGATSIAEVLKKLGYEVILKTNCKQDEYGDILENFESQLQQYDVCIFYYAGHGFQIDGENYLTSIDSQIDSANKHGLERSSIRLTEIFNIIKKSNIHISILIIDACRRNVDRGSNSNFNNINVPKGSIIAFSTSPDEGASDSGFEGNSIYTGALLRHLGKEMVSIEELFKRVRKTVYDISDGKQISWEHTSLIGDFYFNTGQMIHNFDIPYNEKVVKDHYYETNDIKMAQIINGLKSHDWYKQKPALAAFGNTPLNSFTKDDLFIIGRNILQSAKGGEYDANYFIDNLENKLQGYFTNDNENHLLNGILFEIYFNSLGEFRYDNLKKYKTDIIFRLRKNQKFSRSFEFIHKILLPYRSYLFYIPSIEDTEIDVNINAVSKDRIQNLTENKETYQEIKSIKINSKDISKNIYFHLHNRINESKLAQILSTELPAPEELIHIISDIPLYNAIIPHYIEDTTLEF